MTTEEKLKRIKEIDDKVNDTDRMINRCELAKDKTTGEVYNMSVNIDGIQFAIDFVPRALIHQLLNSHLMDLKGLRNKWLEEADKAMKGDDWQNVIPSNKDIIGHV